MGEGYFLEVFSHWVLPVSSLVGDMDARVAVFCKANWIKAKSTVGAGLVRSSGDNGDGDYDLEFRRNLVTIGLNATVNFSLPDFAGRL